MSSCMCWEAKSRCREGKDEAVGGWWMQRWKFPSRQQHGQSEKLHTSVTPNSCGWEPWKRSEPGQGGTQTPDWRDGRQLLPGPSYHWFLLSGLKAGAHLNLLAWAMKVEEWVLVPSDTVLCAEWRMMCTTLNKPLQTSSSCSVMNDHIRRWNWELDFFFKGEIIASCM